MTMIERVALAMFKFDWPNDNWERFGPKDTWPARYRGKACAVIEAMRDPTEVMLPKDGVFIGFGHDADGVEDNMYVDRDEALEVWQAMIDAALKENA